MILDDIVAKTKIRVKRKYEDKPLDELIKEVNNLDITFDYPFEKALKKDKISFILEVKKASPSKGLIVKDFKYLDIAREYERIGASCISVLTEPDFFLGNDNYLKEINNVVSIPTLRKDFIIDEYMIYEAKLLGAKAILLICAILDEKTLKRFFDLGNSLGLSCVVEAHDKDEVLMAKRIGARIIGVNNRNLKDFSVDVHNSIRYKDMVDDDTIFISESGIKTHDDIKVLEDNHVDAVLIGESIVKADDKEKVLKDLRGY